MKRTSLVAVLMTMMVVSTYGQIFNFPPNAVDDNAATLEDVPVTIRVLDNDSDINGDINPSTVDLNVQVIGIQDSVVTTKGTFTSDINGVVTFTPAPAFFGSAAIKYTVSDSTGRESNEADIRVEVEAVNIPPQANDDSGATLENADVKVDILANDTDSDGTLDTSKVDLNLTTGGIQKNATNTFGTWSVNKNNLTYKPKAGFSGTATLDYQVYDNENSPSNTATVTISVASANKPPVATNDAGSTTINTPVTVNVVANDTDPDGTIDATRVDLNTSEAGVQATASNAQGSYSVNTAGEVTYTPLANFTGSAVISYKVSDDKGATSNAATLTISVQASNSAPVATSDNATTSKNVAVSVKVTDNDTDSDGTVDVATVDLNTGTAGIQATATTPQGSYSANASGAVTFTPASNFTGIAAMSYTVNDNNGATSNTAVLNITVQSVNAPPVAANDTGATRQNTVVTLNVVANDTDSDGEIDAAKVDLNTSTAGVQSSNITPQGSWSVSNLGMVTYTPAQNFTGNATLTYTVTDNSAAVSNVATITIAVQTVNAPVAVNDEATTTKNKPVTVRVTQNDSDSDGSIDVTKVDLNTSLAGIQSINETLQGEYTVSSSGVVTFVPASNFTGQATIMYTVDDNTGVTSNAASIRITVQNVNAPPVAASDNAATTQNIAVTVNAIANDVDSDGTLDATRIDLNTSTGGIQSTATTSQGVFSANSLGVVTYTPANNFTGTASVNYTVSDELGAISNVATITIAVQPLNAPVANEDKATTLMNQTVEISILENDRDSDGNVDPATVDLNTSASGVQKTNTTGQGDFSVNSSGVVTFKPKKDFIGTASIKYLVKDNKGINSNTADITVTVQEIPNLSPEIVSFENTSDTLEFVSGNPVVVSSAFEVRDQDDDSLSIAEIGFTNESYVSGDDVLTFENTASVKGQFDIQTGLMTLTGPASISDFNNSIRAVRYKFNGDTELREVVKTIYVRVSDGKKFGEERVRLVRVGRELVDLDVPTAFTPNGDGANDRWRILTPVDSGGADFAGAEIRVYDKRGAVVFGARGLDATWDGTFEGKQLPVDTYYYTIDLKQPQKRYKGIVAILR